MNCQELREVEKQILEAEFVLVGIGREFRAEEGTDGKGGNLEDTDAKDGSLEDTDAKGRSLEDTDAYASRRARLLAAYDSLGKLVKGKPYFIVTENEDELIFESELLDFFIAAPFAAGTRSKAGEEQWNAYQNWLAATLGHSLCILELGVGFSTPQLIRWPFEKIAQFNRKATLIRVNEKFPQTAREVAECAVSIKENAVRWLLTYRD